MTIKGSLYWSIPHSKAVFSCKKTPLKFGPQNGSFLQNGVKILDLSHLDPQKAHPSPERRL